MLPNICVHAVNAENVKAEHTWHAWCTSDNHKPEHACSYSPFLSISCVFSHH